MSPSVIMVFFFEKIYSFFGGDRWERGVGAGRGKSVDGRFEGTGRGRDLKREVS